MSLLRSVRFIVLISFSLMLLGCATSQLKPVANPNAAWQSHSSNMYQIADWQLSGLLGVRMPEQAFSANFTWQQTESSYLINLYGPLGIGATELKGGKQQLRLKLHDGRVLSADNPEELMQDNLGWSLPVEGLVYWVRGLPIPHQPVSLSLNEYGLLSQLQQQGWSIQYLSYQVLNQWPMPKKIRLQNKNISLTVIINDWRVKNS